MANGRAPFRVPYPPSAADHLTRKDYVDARAVPAGGTVGQVLTKQSANDRDAIWAAPTGGPGEGGGTATLRGALDYDDTTAPAEGQAIVWSNTSGKFRPLGLTATMVGADPAGTGAAQRTAHEGSPDPHTQYLTNGRGDARYAALSHAHSASEITSGVLAIARIPTGTTGTTVALGNDSRLSDARTPSGAAGGSLAGTYPNPSIAAGAVGGSEIAAAVKDPAAGTAGLRTLGTGSQQAAAGNDARLSDARTPTAHGHSGADITSGTVGYARLPVGTTASTIVAGDDARLSNARTPTAHVSSHATGGSDALTPAAIGAAADADVVKLTGAQSIQGLKTFVNGVATTAPSAANHAIRNDDSRLADARTPLGHASSHLSGGSDPIAALVPAGGTNGQILAKSSSSDYALAWTNPSSGSGTTINGSGYVTGTVPTGSTTPTITHNLGTRAVTVAVQEASTGLIVPVAVETKDSGGALSTNHVRLSFVTAPTTGQYTYVIFAGAPVQAQVVPVPPVTLTDATTIATDASLSTHFRLAAMAGSRTLGIPTGPVDGQRALWEITASGADRVLTLTTGSTDAFETSTMVPTNTLTIPSGKTGIVGALYSTARRRWTLLAAAVTV